MRPEDPMNEMNIIPAEPAFRHAWRPTPLLLLTIVVHVLAPLFLIFQLEEWQWGVGAVVVNHALLIAAVLGPRGRWLGQCLVRLPARACRRGQVSLTFDDGPHPEITLRVLDLLDRYEAKASFFCIGEKAAAYPDIVREIARRGHSVENHSYAHSPAFAFFGPGKLSREIEATQVTIAASTGTAPRFFRAPAGFRSPFLDPLLARRGLCYAAWTRRGYDAVVTDAQAVLRRLLRNVAAGDVLLLHDSKPLVLDVLPPLLDALAQKHLRSVSLPVACGPDVEFEVLARTPLPV
jgi:peptidoglycan/xylan/chitin deacetylase (PgdA/CDA1 family)